MMLDTSKRRITLPLIFLGNNIHAITFHYSALSFSSALFDIIVGLSADQHADILTCI